MWFKELWTRTKEVAGTYTVIFVVVIFLNQLIFFGLCLNPICLVAAMPHCLAITVFIGTLLRKWNKSGDELRGGTIEKKGEKNITTLLKEQGFYNSDLIATPIDKSKKPLENHIDYNEYIEKLLVLKVLILGHKISSKQTSKTMALDMVNVAINKLRGSPSKQNTLRLIFYLLLKSEIFSEWDEVTSLRKEAKIIAEKTNSDSFRLFMSIQEATQITSTDSGFKKDMFTNIGIDEQNLSEQECDFLFKVTLKEMLEKHGIEYNTQH
jgi:hypothetical protein